MCKYKERDQLLKKERNMARTKTTVRKKGRLELPRPMFGGKEPRSAGPAAHAAAAAAAAAAANKRRKK
jgi:hypothetical protein